MVQSPKKSREKRYTCKLLVNGSVYIPPDATVMTRASGAAFSNSGITSSVRVYGAATFTAKLSSNLLKIKASHPFQLWGS